VNVAAVVLAAGGSRRLGRPKQLLAYRGTTLLDVVLATARGAELAQVVVALGGSASAVRSRVDVRGLDIVVNDDFGDGCATSIRSALGAVRDDVDGAVLLLGDQPGVTVDSIASLVEAAGERAVGVCEYDDGLGHPLWFHRRMFDTLTALHGDKAVWRLVDGGEDVATVPVAGSIPPDVDTWADYEALLGVRG
jgi:molybdenum cofactor cytidylyltransferase